MYSVIPVKTGIQNKRKYSHCILDPRLREDDKRWFCIGLCVRTFHAILFTSCRRIVPSLGVGLRKELKFASFWVRNRIPLRRFGYGFLILVNAIVWLYSAWGLLDAYAISYPRESRLTQDIATNQLTLESLLHDQPQPVATGNAQVF